MARPFDLWGEWCYRQAVLTLTHREDTDFLAMLEKAPYLPSNFRLRVYGMVCYRHRVRPTHSISVQALLIFSQRAGAAAFILACHGDYFVETFCCIPVPPVPDMGNHVLADGGYDGEAAVHLHG